MTSVYGLEAMNRTLGIRPNVIASAVAAVLAVSCSGSDRLEDRSESTSEHVVVTLSPTPSTPPAQPESVDQEDDVLQIPRLEDEDAVWRPPMGRFRIESDPIPYVDYFFIEFTPDLVGVGVQFSVDWWQEDVFQRVGLRPDDVLSQMHLSSSWYRLQADGEFDWSGEGLPLLQQSAVDPWNSTRVYWLTRPTATMTDGVYVGPHELSLSIFEESGTNIGIDYPTIDLLMTRDDPLMSPFGRQLGSVISAVSDSGNLVVEIYRNGGFYVEGFKHGTAMAGPTEETTLRVRVDGGVMCERPQVEPDRFTLEVTVTDPVTGEVIGSSSSPLLPPGSPELLMDTPHREWPCEQGFLDWGPLSWSRMEDGVEIPAFFVPTGPQLSFLDGSPFAFVVEVRLIDATTDVVEKVDLLVPAAPEFSE